MAFKNTKYNYGSLTKGVHWISALIVMGLIVVAYIMMAMPPSPGRWQLYSLHKSFGILVLFLTFVRIGWRLLNMTPQHNLPSWQVGASHLVHFSLYGLVLAMPISGYLMSTASGREVLFFGFNVPRLVEKNEVLASSAHNAHEIISYALISMIVIHLIAALGHHFILKDNVLKRMLISSSSKK